VLFVISGMSIGYTYLQMFYARRGHIDKITNFQRGTIFNARVRRPLEPRGLKLRLLKSVFDAKISYAGCLGLSPAISLHLILELCAAAKKCEKFAPNPSFGDSMSF